MANKSEDVKAATYGYIDISLAERMINRYNGDKANLHVFIDNCNNAYSLLNPVYGKAFVSVVLSKIEGNIRATLLNRSFASWNVLKEHLLENYSEKRTFAQWQLELNSCRQKSNEPVLQYSNRVESCLIKLIKSLDPKLTSSARDANIELLKSQALNIFISGLLPQLHILLKSQKPTNFEEAVSIAISEEQEIKSRYEMNYRQDSRPNKFSNNKNNSGVYNRHMQVNKNIPTCFVCKKRGHIARDCWHNQQNQNNYNKNQSRTGNYEHGSFSEGKFRSSHNNKPNNRMSFSDKESDKKNLN